MKKISFAVIALLLMLCVFAFTACGDSRPELTLTTNIEGAGTVTGGGHFDYNENLSINAEVNNGYHFLGWYYDNDLLSTSAEYNCQMWDKDVTLEAKFIALPDDYDEAFGDMSPEELINRNFKLSVVAGMPNYGKISVNDGDNKVKYSSSEKSGTSIKARALTTSSQRFLGWFDEADNLVMTNAVFNFSTPSFDYTLTAKWECNCEYTYNKENKTYACDACGNSYDISEIGDENGFLFFNNELVAYIGDNTEITLPSNITTIKSGIFSGNRKITSVNIPANVKVIADAAFKDCKSIRTITFADGATVTIGNSAFYDCASLTSIVIPEGVTSIGKYAFKNCTRLTSVIIPDSVTNIGEYAFHFCTSLTSIVIPEGVTSIGSYAFENCTRLTSVIIPDSVTNIGFSAFRCTSLTSIVIPEGVTSIGNRAFDDCTSLTSITVSEGNKNYKSVDGNLYSKDGKTFIQYTTGKADTTFTVPKGVTTIGFAAFHGCTSLTSIVIPEGVTTIGEYAFDYCDSLTIYCEAASKPSGWNPYWNDSNRPVVWGYKG